MFCTELSVLPTFTDIEHNKLIDLFRSNYHLVYNFEKGYTDYVNLYSFPNKFEMLSDILGKFNIDSKYINSMSIQEIYTSLQPHKDRLRKVSMLYNIVGLADTNFFSKDFDTPIVKRMKLHTWYLFDNASVHSVTNIAGGTRLGLVIDLTSHFTDYQTAYDYFNSQGATGLFQNAN